MSNVSSGHSTHHEGKMHGELCTKNPSIRLILDLNLPSPLDNYDQKLLQINLRQRFLLVSLFLYLTFFFLNVINCLCFLGC
jgi:hypothetical protein